MHCIHCLQKGTMGISGMRWGLEMLNRELQNLFPLVLRGIAGVARFCPSWLWAAQICCALEQDVFFYAVFWHCALFLCTLVLHPTTFAGNGYFYWKMTNVYKLLFPPFPSLPSFLLPSIPPSLHLSLSLSFSSSGTKVAGCLE